MLKEGLKLIDNDAIMCLFTFCCWGLEWMNERRRNVYLHLNGFNTDILAVCMWTTALDELSAVFVMRLSLSAAFYIQMKWQCFKWLIVFYTYPA